jgi:hypothetical protein
MWVFTAISENRTPDPADVEILNTYAPLLSHLSPDELACDVIQQALRRREQVRGNRSRLNHPLSSVTKIKVAHYRKLTR